MARARAVACVTVIASQRYRGLSDSKNLGFFNLTNAKIAEAEHTFQAAFLTFKRAPESKKYLELKNLLSQYIILEEVVRNENGGSLKPVTARVKDYNTFLNSQDELINTLVRTYINREAPGVMTKARGYHS